MFCFVLTSPPLMLCVYLQTFEAALFWKKKKDPRRVDLNDSVRLGLRRPDWRTTVLAALSSLGQLTYHPGDHSPPRPDPPWSRPPPAPTAMTDVSKSMSRDKQLAATLAAIEDTGPTDIQVYIDGSTHEGTTDGGAGMVAMSGEDIIERWHAQPADGAARTKRRNQRW